MAHKEQIDFVRRVKQKFPSCFENKVVLDIGSFDVNGNNKEHFKNCDFTGIDIGPGPCVDIICPAQDFDAPDDYYSTIISTECLEHNEKYAETLQNAVRMLKPGGLLLFACATTGRKIHGTAETDKRDRLIHENWITMPNVFMKGYNNNYYKNLTEEDIREAIDIDEIFEEYQFEVNADHKDLYFYGIKSEEECFDASDRTVPFDEDGICDICGNKGAWDFMGDVICPKCWEKNR